ncbi:MAG: pyruvate kinase [Actinomycetota bacterium]|nr:pyruvate kinase [Actinomycetota bacterium]
MRATKIVATIGPASRDPATLEAMVRAGLDVARLNFAHGTVDEHAETAERVRAAARRVGRSVAILQDIPGPKLRIGPVAGGVTELTAGSRVVLTADAVEGTAEQLPVASSGIAELIGPDDVAYLADGRVRLRVNEVHDGDVVTRVEVGGSVASRQALNLPNVGRSLPAVGEADLQTIDAGIEMGVDLLALSVVRRREDLQPVREHLAERGRDLSVIAKIENQEATENIEEIMAAADGLLVARGELGIELPIEDVPVVQKRLLELAGQAAKPSITATQMLESMVRSNRPTRAEVTDVANAIFDGTDAVTLSEETAVGAYPVEAVEMMASIAEVTERELPYGYWLRERGPQAQDEQSAIAYGAVGAVYQLGLKALVVPTRTGTTPALVAAHRPNVPVLALTDRAYVAKRLSMVWGVRAELFEEAETTPDLLERCAAMATRCGLAGPGDRIGITAGIPPGKSGGTNLFKVHRIE